MRRRRVGDVAGELRIAAHEPHAREIDLRLRVERFQPDRVAEGALRLIDAIKLQQRPAACEGKFESGQAQRFRAGERLHRILRPVHPCEHGSEIVMSSRIGRRQRDRLPIRALRLRETQLVPQRHCEQRPGDGVVTVRLQQDSRLLLSRDMLSQIVQRPGESDVGRLMRRIDLKRLTITRRSFPFALRQTQEIGQIAAEFQLTRFERDALAHQPLSFVNVARLLADQPEHMRRSGIAAAH